MTIANHQLLNSNGNPVPFKESPNTSGPFAQAGAPDTIIIHFTAGASAASSIATLTDGAGKARVSAHLVVGRDNSITQLVPFNKIAWHAGPSSYGGRSKFNLFSIGIEIDNAGPLSKQGSTYLTWFGRSIPPTDVFEGIHRNQKVFSYWHRYTEEQIALVYDICSAIIQAYDIQYILGHEEISPAQKVDPGPAFPLDKMRERLLTGNRAANEPAIAEAAPITIPVSKKGFVIADKLNIRSGAGSANPLVSSPLPHNTTVNVVEELNGWYRVQAQVEGWVFKDYVKLQ